MRFVAVTYLPPFPAADFSDFDGCFSLNADDATTNVDNLCLGGKLHRHDETLLSFSTK
jgi:hypothetical protein